jgi:hypothetical protein
LRAIFSLKVANVSLERIDLSLKDLDVAGIAKHRANRDILSEPTILGDDMALSFNGLAAPRAPNL